MLGKYGLHNLNGQAIQVQVLTFFLNLINGLVFLLIC